MAAELTADPFSREPTPVTTASFVTVTLYDGERRVDRDTAMSIPGVYGDGKQSTVRLLDVPTRDFDAIHGLITERSDYCQYPGYVYGVVTSPDVLRLAHRLGVMIPTEMLHTYTIHMHIDDWAAISMGDIVPYEIHFDDVYAIQVEITTVGQMFYECRVTG